MKEFFSRFAPNELNELFDNEHNCLKALAQWKWEHGYRCCKCKHDNYCKGKRPFSRRCTRCKHDESAIANTLFHGCRLPLNLVFKMAYEVCCRPEVSSYELSRNWDIRQMTCWKLKRKLKEKLFNID